MVHKFTASFIITSLNNNNWLEPVVFHRSMQTRGMTQFCFFLAGIWVVFVLQLENKCFIQLWVDCDWFKNILGLHVKIFENVYKLFSFML